jgi:hypothetical protein
MKSMQTKQQGLRTRLRNNQAEIRRLMVEYENLGAIVVNGDGIQDMNDWLVNTRPKRRASVAGSPDPVRNTQLTDGSTQPSQSTLGQSQISDAASEALAAGSIEDDYTGESEDEEDEERSVNTETGLPDTQASDSLYETRSGKKKRKKRKAKKESKKEKKNRKRDEKRKGMKRDNSPPRSPSY